MIMFLGGMAVFCVSRKDRFKKYGYIFGLCSQPFWVYTSIQNKQWGILILTFWYSYNWYKGIKNYWR